MTLLSEAYPHLREQFKFCVDQNGNILTHKTFNMLTTGSHDSAIWECPKVNCNNNCKHIFKTAIYNRVKRNGTVCPYCAGQKICPCNSLAKKHPELMDEWDFENNGDLNPEEIAVKSGKRIHWICKKSKCSHVHRWSTAVSNRTRLKSACPYCAGQRLCPCDSLASKYPHLAAEWDHESNGNLKPEDVAPGSVQHVYWICRKSK